ALLYYDYALTFPEEVELIWGVKFTPSTLLYILCRYAMLANLLYALAFLDKIGLRVDATINSCDTWYKIIAVLAVFGRAAVIVTFTLRTYAIWAQSRLVLVLLAMIGLATVITDAVHSFFSPPCLTCSKGTFRYMFRSKVAKNHQGVLQCKISIFLKIPSVDNLCIPVQQ
ncbi:hypothetical protein BT96DRAFT_820860, partial [Gymnopus androsaceus JB14]